MLGTDAQEVSIAGHNHHVQLGPGHLYAQGDGQGPAVNTVEAIGLAAL